MKNLADTLSLTVLITDKLFNLEVGVVDETIFVLIGYIGLTEVIIYEVSGLTCLGIKLYISVLITFGVEDECNSLRLLCFVLLFLGKLNQQVLQTYWTNLGARLTLIYCFNKVPV